MIEILIVGDSYIPSHLFQTSIVSSLKGMNDYKICIRKIDLKIGETSSFESLEMQENKIIAQISNTNILVVNMAQVTSHIIDSAKNLRLICCPRSGPVNIDIEAANRRGIPVLYSPDRTTNSVAEFTIGLILSLARNISKASCAYKNGFVLAETECLGIELKEKKLGIIGFGRIGRAVAAKARALGMQIIIHDPYIPKNSVDKKNGRLVELDKLLEESDFVTLHVRLTKDNVNLLGKREIALMKKESYLINTARGLLVNEEALCRALKEKRIAGAALDVLVRDKDPKTTFRHLENVILTPHMAASTLDLLEISPTIVGKQIKSFFENEEMKFVAKPEDFKFERQLILDGKVTE